VRSTDGTSSAHPLSGEKRGVLLTPLLLEQLLVDPQGQGRIGVADLLLHKGGVASGGQQQADAGAAKRVRGAFQDLLNAPVAQELVRLRDHRRCVWND